MATYPIPTFYLGHLAETLSQMNIDIDGFLHPYGLSVERLMEPGKTVSVDVFDALMALIGRESPKPELGLLVGQRLHLMHHGAFGLALINCENIHQMVEFVRDMLVIRMPYLELSVTTNQKYLVVMVHDIHWKEATHRFVMEALSVAFYNLQNALAQMGNTVKISKFMFDYPEPQYRDAYSIFGDCELVFNCNFSGLCVPIEEISTRLQGGDPSVWWCP